jgi:myo-inositol-1(or 4)-monophosphatase
LADPALLELAARAAREAGALLRQRPAAVSHKGAVDLVTQIDLASEETLRAIFARETPEIPVLAEEGGGADGARTRWIIDPLDGTTNFVHGFPFYCVSIGLEVEGELEVGVIYDPVRDRCYQARRGGGAFVNDERLSVSAAETLGASLVASGFAYDRRERPDDYLAFVRAFLVAARGFRRCGSAAMDLAMVASGQLDGYWEFNLNAWDVAAGALLVREAGGRCTDVLGGPLTLSAPRVLASNGRIHDAMSALIAPLLDRTAISS